MTSTLSSSSAKFASALDVRFKMLVFSLIFNTLAIEKAKKLYFKKSSVYFNKFSVL